jgi:hypothetical protein
MGAAVAVIAVLAIGPASASGAMTLGSTQSANTACAAPNTVDVQTAVTPGVNSYTVPAGGGVITSWQHQARQIAGALLKFKVLRPLSPLAGAASFQFVGESAFQAVPQPIFYDFPVRIPVNAGDRIGLATASNAATAPPACNTGGETIADEVYEGADGSSTLNPFNTFRLNISAKLEPDADKDGYGDETQDKCATDAKTQGTCPPPSNKCKKGKKKKKKKKRSASAAKKKKKKKKKC